MPTCRRCRSVEISRLFCTSLLRTLRYNRFKTCSEIIAAVNSRNIIFQSSCHSGQELRSSLLPSRALHSWRNTARAKLDCIQAERAQTQSWLPSATSFHFYFELDKRRKVDDVVTCRSQRSEKC